MRRPGTHGAHGAAGHDPDVVAGDHVGGVGHGQEQGPLGRDPDRDDLVPLRQGAGDQVDHLVRDGHGGEVDVAEAELSGQGAGDLALGADPAGDEDLAQTAPPALLALLELQGLEQLDLRDDARRHQNLTQLGMRLPQARTAPAVFPLPRRLLRVRSALHYSLSTSTSRSRFGAPVPHLERQLGRQPSAHLGDHGISE